MRKSRTVIRDLRPGPYVCNSHAEGGTDLATLAAILGHGSIRMVQAYVHPTAEHKKAAMARYADRMKSEQEITGRVN